MWWECENCGGVYQYDCNEDIPTRQAELEDGVGGEIAICPICHSPIYELKTCELCGGASGDNSYCSACKKKVLEDFEQTFLPKYKQIGKSMNEVGTILADIIAEF